LRGRRADRSVNLNESPAPNSGSFHVAVEDRSLIELDAKMLRPVLDLFSCEVDCSSKKAKRMTINLAAAEVLFGENQ